MNRASSATVQARPRASIPKTSTGLCWKHLHPAEQPVLKAIPAKCLDCCCYQETEVRKCIAVGCALWPSRMGTNPLRKKKN
jgi:hypothetical protein